MKPAKQEQGYFRGDRAAARYLDMDRRTFARLMKAGDVRPAIKGGFRYWRKSVLDAFMAPQEGTAYTVRPGLSARNRARGGRTTAINNAQQGEHPTTPNV